MNNQPSCLNCIYSDVVAKAGELYTFLNPHGTDITRKYDNTIILCRAEPPISGSWPQVTEEDWCGRFEADSP